MEFPIHYIFGKGSRVISISGCEGGKYSFKYDPRKPEKIFEMAMEAAKNTAFGFSWYDAAVLSFKFNKLFLGKFARALFSPRNLETKATT